MTAITHSIMTTYQRSDPIQKMVVGFSGGTLVLVIAMFGWWANRLQDTTDKLADIQKMQAVQLATLEQIVMGHELQIERNRDMIDGRR